MKKKYLRVLVIVLLSATLLFIWSSSAQSRDDSTDRSMGLLNKIADVLALIGVNIDRTDDHWLRKLAHFSEFAALGAELSALMLLYDRRGVQAASSCLFASLCTATIDETIQLFSSRGSSVLDVLLDFSGAALAVLIIFICVIIKDKKTIGR